MKDVVRQDFELYLPTPFDTLEKRTAGKFIIYQEIFYVVSERTISERVPVPLPGQLVREGWDPEVPSDSSKEENSPKEKVDFY